MKKIRQDTLIISCIVLLLLVVGEGIIIYNDRIPIKNISLIPSDLVGIVRPLNSSDTHYIVGFDIRDPNQFNMLKQIANYFYPSQIASYPNNKKEVQT